MPWPDRARSLRAPEDTVDAWRDPRFQLRLGALLRSAANDLKRDDAAAETDLGLAPGSFAEYAEGRRLITWALLNRAAGVWPLNERDMLPMHDDCPDGVLVHRAAASRASARIIERGGAPYYEYRDTATSRLASYRPEWIRMLCVVDDDDPDNLAVQWNDGHLLYQFTYFVGPVNYYSRWGGRTRCVSMRTGDSVFGVPFTPHSFAARSATEPGYILALTYGGALTGDAQRELAVLGEAAARAFTLEPGEAGQAALLRGMLDARALPAAEAARRAALSRERVDAILAGRRAATAEELASLAATLRVGVRELLPLGTATAEGVVIRPAAATETWSYPDDTRPAYRIRGLATDTLHPHTTALELALAGGLADGPAWLSTYQHQYVYVLGETSARITWEHRGRSHVAELHPADSAYVQPHVPIAFATDGREAVLLVLRIAGAVTTDVRFALGAMAEGGRARYLAEDRPWYRPHRTVAS